MLMACSCQDSFLLFTSILLLSLVAPVLLLASRPSGSGMSRTPETEPGLFHSPHSISDAPMLQFLVAFFELEKNVDLRTVSCSKFLRCVFQLSEPIPIESGNKLIEFFSFGSHFFVQSFSFQSSFMMRVSCHRLRRIRYAQRRRRRRARKDLLEPGEYWTTSSFF